MLRGTLVVLALAAVIGAGAYFVVAPTAGGGCDAPFAEPIDPNSSQHLLPGAPEPRYLSDPPTSGAHQPGTYSTGIVTRPFSRPQQVTLLEQGEVLVQYRDASSKTRRDLRGLVRSTHGVTIAPNPSLHSRIVVTAWLWKMNCDSFSEKDVREFVRVHQPDQPVSR